MTDRPFDRSETILLTKARHWERAKCELKSMLVTQGFVRSGRGPMVDQEEYSALDSKIDAFITDIESQELEF